MTNIARHLDNSVGPNAWGELEPDVDFGPEHDFNVQYDGSAWIIDPISNAALQWCYRFLPQDAPRWGKGYLIEAKYITEIVRRMRDCGLMSHGDYVEMMMHAAERDSHAGENR